MRIGWTLVAIGMLSPGVAAAQDGFAVEMSEEITLTLDGAPKASAPIGIAPNAFEIRTGVEFSRGDHDAAVGPNSKPIGGGTPTVTPNMVRVRFTPVAGRKPGSLLVIANGYDRALVWHAVMRVQGRTQPTDVCVVLPGQTGVEHWPYPIEAIGLVDVRLEAWKPEDAVRCE